MESNGEVVNILRSVRICTIIAVLHGLLFLAAIRDGTLKWEIA